MTDIRHILKGIVPKSATRAIRYHYIRKDQERAASLLNGYIDDYYKGKIQQYELSPKKDLGTDKIIWQYWAQGIDSDLPEVVKICFDSVDKWKGEYTVIRLFDKDIFDYIELPEFVQDRMETFSRTSFSDLLRLALLSTYGGIWMDATVLMTGPIPECYKALDFFMFSRSDKEKHKKYWEDVYSYYFGWQEWFKVRILSSIVFGKAGNIFIRDLFNLLLTVWRENDKYPFYFALHVLYNEMEYRYPASPTVNDCPPHALMQFINDINYKKIESLDDILQHSTMHKLSYKNIDRGRLDSVVEILRADGLI